MTKLSATNFLVKIVICISLCFSIFTFQNVLVNPQHVEAATTKTQKANLIIKKGKSYMGTPYKFGASTRTTRVFDCSSFVKRIYQSYGITLPRTSKKQSKVGKYVSRSNLKPGDLVFFYKPVSHVAVYIGNGKILHTYGKPGVTISNMKTGWWKKHYTTARRVL